MRVKRISLIIGAVLFLIVCNCFKSNACVDTFDSTGAPVLVVYYFDSDTSVIIKVKQLTLAGGVLGQFCSCAINSQTGIFSNIEYVKFVETGTLNLVLGFDGFSENAVATTDWDATINSGPIDWNGFVSSVSSSGLLNGASVDLIIKATIPPGHDSTSLSLALNNTGLGADEWDNAGNQLANTHLSFVQFKFMPTKPYVDLVPPQFIQAIDGALVGIGDVSHTEMLQVHPNPFTRFINVRVNREVTSYKVYNALGELTLSEFVDGSGKSELKLDLSKLTPGLFILILETPTEIITRKIVKSGLG